MRSSRKENLRAFRRVGVRMPILLRDAGNGSKIRRMASTLDLSFLGTRIRAKTALKIGEKVEIVRLTGPSHPVPARVAWVGSKGSDLQGQVGLLYTDPLHAHLPLR